MTYFSKSLSQATVDDGRLQVHMSGQSEMRCCACGERVIVQHPPSTRAPSAHGRHCSRHASQKAPLPPTNAITHVVTCLMRVLHLVTAKRALSGFVLSAELRSGSKHWLPPAQPLRPSFALCEPEQCHARRTKMCPQFPSSAGQHFCESTNKASTSRQVRQS